jgi:hypothetical protein
MSFPSTCRIALKEWAVTQGALDDGDQVLLLRKGGIREEGKEFRVIENEFFIYPTYEHQHEELLKPEYRGELKRILAQPYNPQEIAFTHWGRIEEALEVAEQQKVDDLSPLYIWTTDYASKRLHWKPRKPLLVMLVRIYRLKSPQSIPFVPAYAGCKSWVTLDHEVQLGDLMPVLSDERFAAKCAQVRAILKKHAVE